MNANWLPLSAATCEKPSAHPRGSLVALTRTSDGADSVWALRYDEITEDEQEHPCLFFPKGNPWGHRGENIARCTDFSFDERAAIGIGAAHADIGIEVAETDWIHANRIAWYDTKNFVAMGSFGFRLLGYERVTPSSYRWVDCRTWTARVGETIGDSISAHAQRWRVVVNMPRERKIAIEVEPPKNATP